MVRTLIITMVYEEDIPEEQAKLVVQQLEGTFQLIKTIQHHMALETSGETIDFDYSVAFSD